MSENGPANQIGQLSWTIFVTHWARIADWIQRAENTKVRVYGTELHAKLLAAGHTGYQRGSR